MQFTPSQKRFRAWDSINKKFVFTGFHVIGEVTLLGALDIYKHEHALNLEQTLKLEITQFTGFLDSKGVEIYEGDILSEKWKALVYQHKNGAWMVKFVLNPSINKPRTLLHYLTQRERAGEYFRDCTVIGNYYENANLLKNP